MLADSLVRSRGTEDIVGEDLDLLMLDWKSKGFLSKDLVGQVFFLA
jgi:hypothetical protein